MFKRVRVADPLVIVHQLVSEKNREYSTKCNQTVTFRHLVSGWHSDITCEECLR